jgi:tetratricopeptide (TPR) repeat protein
MIKRFSRLLMQNCVLLLVLSLAIAVCQRSPQARSAAYLDAGKRLMQKNDAARALLQFRNAVKLTPDNPEVHFQLGRAYLAHGDLMRCVASLRKAIELNPKHADAQLLFSKVLASADDPTLLQDAAQRLQELLTSNPGSSDSVHTLGLTELKLGHPADGIRHLEQALALAPQDLTYAVTLAQAKMQQQDWAGAEDIFKKACQNSPKSIDAVILLGRFYGFRQDYAKAAEQFQKALSLEPKNPASLLNLAAVQMLTGQKAEAEQNYKKLSSLLYKPTQPIYALFLFEQGRKDEAITELKRLAEADPDDREARTRLIAAYQATNRQPEAIKVLNSALKENPKDLDALLQRGELALNAGNLADAEPDLNRVLRLKPDSAQVHYALSRLYKARGTLLTQRQELNEVLRLNPYLLSVRIELAQSLIADNSSKAALDILDAAPDTQKNLLPTIEQRNWAYLGIGDIARARQGVDQGLAVSRTADLLLQDAMLKMNSQRYADARLTVKEALLKAPEDTRGLRVLVGTYAAQQQVGTAVAEVQAHAALYPRSSEVQFFLGNLLLEAGNKNGAQQAFSQAVSLNPKYKPAELALARISLTQAKWTDAKQQLSAILAADENPQARLWLGMLEESVGNHGAALAEFRKAVDNQPDSPIALNNLAYVLAEHAGKPDEALKLAEKAVSLAPDNPDVQDTLGWVLYRKGLYANAVTQLQAAATKGGTALQQYHLAMACLKAGQEKRGQTVLEAALKKDPNLPEAKIAKAMFGTP